MDPGGSGAQWRLSHNPMEPLRLEMEGRLPDIH